VTAIAVFSAVAVGTLLRLAVVWTDPAADFLNDSAYHWRMVNAAVAHGHVPEPDVLSDPPAGRDVASLLPLELYRSAAAFHAAASGLGSRDLRFNVLLFVALAGGLVALPVWAAARAMLGGGWAPVAAAFLAALSPAHLHRTYAYWLRYDALGTLLIVAHLAFALRALNGRRVWIESALSAACLFASIATWRVALAIPVIEIGFVVVWGIVGEINRPLSAWLSAQ
jgi:asparagine N-glycosylation enzyme membrane subunit Stt3